MIRFGFGVCSDNTILLLEAFAMSLVVALGWLVLAALLSVVMVAAALVMCVVAVVFAVLLVVVNVRRGAPHAVRGGGCGWR